MVIGVSELQKNISIFKNLTESIHVIDKKTKEILATILPNKQLDKPTLTEMLGGSLASKPIGDCANINDMAADAYEKEMRAKYGK